MPVYSDGKPHTASLNDANTWAQKQTLSGEIEIDGALNHDGSTAGFFGVTPTTRPTAYTQTYATADKTIATPVVALTDNSGGTSAGDTVPAITLDAVNAAGRESTRNAIATLTAKINALQADMVDAKQAINALIDDQQALGLGQ